MKLVHIRRKIDHWLKRDAPRAEFASDNAIRHLSAHSTHYDGTLSQETEGLKLSVIVDAKRDPTDRRGMKPKVMEWRRRVLVRKGARMHALMLERSDGGSLAMLDARGVVVGWYEGSGRTRNANSQGTVLNHHVSQFYMPTDVTANVPDSHLKAAASAGSSTERGWRRRSDGSTYWATTVIEPIALQDGPVQGFSHITREYKEPISAHAYMSSGAVDPGAHGISSSAGAQ